MTAMAALIAAGYGGLIWFFGWRGLVLAAVHLAILMAFTRRR